MGASSIERAAENAAQKAQTVLLHSPPPPVAAARSAWNDLGTYYAARGVDDWAAGAFESADPDRVDFDRVPPELLASIYWRLGRLIDADREFNLALTRAQTDEQKVHLKLCIAAVEADKIRGGWRTIHDWIVPRIQTAPSQ